MQDSIQVSSSPEVQYLLRIGDTALILGQRLGARVKAWEEGAWVREAALAYARRQQPEQQAA